CSANTARLSGTAYLSSIRTTSTIAPETEDVSFKLRCIIADNPELPMIKRRFVALSTAVLTIVLVRLSTQLQDYAAAEKLPMRLTDQEFWKLSADTSETGGSFHSVR